MSGNPLVDAAKRRVRRISVVRDVSTMVTGAAGALAVLHIVRVLTDQPEAFPVVVISALVIISVVVELITRRRHDEAVEDLELALLNAARADADATR